MVTFLIVFLWIIFLFVFLKLKGSVERKKEYILAFAFLCVYPYSLRIIRIY